MGWWISAYGTTKRRGQVLRVIFLFATLAVSAFADVTVGNCTKSYDDQGVPIEVGFSPFSFAFHLDVDQVVVKTRGHEVSYDFTGSYVFVWVDGVMSGVLDPSTAADEIK